MGSHAKKTNSLLDQSRGRSNREFDEANETSRTRSNTAYADQRSGRDDVRGRFTGYADTGGLDPDEIDRYRSTFSGYGDSGYGGGGGGGSSVADELATTGGIDESVFGSALRGYENFASGGGGLDVDAMRQRANSVIPSFYKNLQNNLSRRKMINPYGPTYDAEGASLARQAGQQTQENIRDTELGISEQVAANRKFGIAGLGGLHTNIQGMKQQGKIAGGSQQISNAGLGLDAARLRESSAARRQQGEADILDRRERGRLTGLGGLVDMYGMDRDDARGYHQDRYGGMTNRAGIDSGYISGRQDPSAWWKDLTRAGLGGAASVASGYYGGRGGR